MASAVEMVAMAWTAVALLVEHELRMVELDWTTMHASTGLAWKHELRRFMKSNCKTWGLGRMA